MRIESSERIVYEHNPLAEVVCQVRFERLDEMSDAVVDALKLEFAAEGYPGFFEETTFGIVHHFGTDGGVQQPVALPQIRIRHFSSTDGAWKISICVDFVALTCLRYTSWGEFLPRLLAAAASFQLKYQGVVPLRLGLRYKDVIEREPLGLAGVAWHELIKPFLLGPLAPDALAEGQTATDADTESFLSQMSLRLNDAMLLLQSSLLTSVDGQRRAFLIDADFFNEGDLEPGLLTASELLLGRLDALHANAGALFRRGITERLHHALRPRN